MRYELKLEEYQGPLDKLLELIEGKKLEVTQLSLAHVTADFLEYVQKLQKQFDAEEGNQPESERSNLKHAAHAQLLADFLVVASKLILIKSKALLPTLPLTEEEEMETKDLEARLRLYQELKVTQRHLKDVWQEYPRVYSRELFATSEILFYPPRNASADRLHAAVAHLIGELERTLRPAMRITTYIINLKEKIEEVLKRLRDTPTQFTQLAGKGTRGELVVLFLAVLHLLKEQLIHVEQTKHFDEMVIVKKASHG